MFDPKETQDAATNATRALGRMSGMGITLALGTTLFAGLGWLLDQKLGTSPWFLAILGVLGGAASLYKFVRDIQLLETPDSGSGSVERESKDD